MTPNVDELSPEARAYFEWLVKPVEQGGAGYTMAFPMGEGMWAGIKPLMFHWTLNSGLIHDYDGIEGRWCYADAGRALQGIIEWHKRDFEGEPDGWRRHPQTGRRRNDDGDPASEYISH